MELIGLLALVQQFIVITGYPSDYSSHPDYVPNLKVPSKQLGEDPRLSATATAGDSDVDIDVLSASSSKDLDRYIRSEKRRSAVDALAMEARKRACMEEEEHQRIEGIERQQSDCLVSSWDHDYSIWKPDNSPTNSSDKGHITIATVNPSQGSKLYSDASVNSAVSIAVDKDLDNPYLEVTKLEKEVERLQEYAKQCQEKAADAERLSKLIFGVHFIENDDEKTCYYTGLPKYAVFVAFCNYLQRKAESLTLWRGESSTPREKANCGRKSTVNLPIKEQLFMVLVRLRLGLGNKDIADRYGLSQTHFSRLFTTWITFLSKELSPFSTSIEGAYQQLDAR